MQHHRAFLPFAATLAAVALLCLMDVFMKSAALVVGAYTALLLRSLINLAVIGPVWLAIRERPTTPEARRVHLRRGAVMAAMGLLFFYGLVRLPLAEALALSFIAPIIALILAALLLGERIGRPAIIASLLGFAGVLAIALTRMGAGGEGPGSHPEAAWGTAAILVSAVLFAWNLVLQRQQALLAAPAEVATWQNLVVGALLLVGAPFFLLWPDKQTWLAIGASAALSLVGVMLFAWAYRRAEAQALVPLEYTGFAWGALFGWLFLAEAVRPAVLAGAVLIVLGCWIAAPRSALGKRTEQTAV